MTVAAIAPTFGAVACKTLSASLTAPDYAGAAWILALALVVAGSASIAGAFGYVVQNGGFVLLSIAPKAERLNPIEGLKRLLSRETALHSLRAALAFTCAVAVISPFLLRGALGLLQTASPLDAAATAWAASREVALAVAGVGFCFAIAEYGAARNIWLRKLRMSLHERKRELKEEEGDATARGRRRALHRALLATGIHRLKDAAFVVSNPEHVAVALEYQPPTVPVPRVLVRAADAAALRVREIAAAYSIPVVEDVRLARALYRDARIGRPIPLAHYVAVAEVVAALRHGESSA